MSEWLIEPVSKTGVPFAGTAGSNPALSVIFCIVVRTAMCDYADFRAFGRDTGETCRESLQALASTYNASGDMNI